ncbi:MAG: hypothetical protein NZ899_10025 [Thermoguttaceae bacterium]|nr:hypothetical protein [Thermoguttaceae bacterium]MDW8078024.1 hypothetical protein [Thermoguttaceae bacterium]
MSHQTVSIPELVERIHRSGKHLAMVITGGGAAAISWLLTQPGASRSILEIVVPYHDQALCEYLGHRPEQFCSLATSRALAMVGFFRARRIAGQVTNCIGLACTASLVTDRPKRGDHRVHVAYQGETTAGSSSLVLQKGARDRSAEDELAARLVLWELAEACGLEARPALPILPGEDPQMSRVEAPTSWSAVLLGNTPFTFARGEPAAPDLTKLAILPGSFNPFHEGHRRMIQVASRHLGRPVVLELSVINADKPPVDYCSLADRLAGIPAEIPVILSQAPTFAEKARLFPGCVFLVGIDTLLRIADPRFYGGSVAARDRAIKEIAEAGCRFLVFGRLIEGEFRELDSAGVPEFLRSLCQGISESEFRMDISSTEVRRGRGGPSQPETPN